MKIIRNIFFLLFFLAGMTLQAQVKYTVANHLGEWHVYLDPMSANAQSVDDRKRIEVTNNLVIDPVEVRYAWARNPMGNLVDEDYQVIAVPLFRSDKWEYPEAPYLPDEYAAHRTNLKMLRKQASEMGRVRIIREAELILKENNK